MSTCIDVHSASATVPTLGEFAAAVRDVLIECKDRPSVHRMLGEFDPEQIHVLVERLDESESQFRPTRDADPSTSLATPEDHLYGWLSIDALGLGFDFYNDEGDWFEDVPYEGVIAEYEERAKLLGTLHGFPVEDAAKLKREWSMRLQATQPPKTRLVAGFAAAALARLTNGFIYSDDGGADYDRCPTDPETFLSWYPEWCESGDE